MSDIDAKSQLDPDDYRKFELNLDNPPHFVFRQTEMERLKGEESMRRIGREYQTLCRIHSITAHVPLSNGSLAGEYAVWLIRNTHKRRSKSRRIIDNTHNTKRRRRKADTR